MNTVYSNYLIQSLKPNKYCMQKHSDHRQIGHFEFITQALLNFNLNYF